MEHLQQSLDADNDKDFIAVREEVKGMLTSEELKWKQRAKMTWLQNGDHNTKFYHHCGNQRKKMNLISKVMDEERFSHTKLKAIGEAFTRYYQDLFNLSHSVNVTEYL